VQIARDVSTPIKKIKEEIVLRTFKTGNMLHISVLLLLYKKLI